MFKNKEKKKKKEWNAGRKGNADRDWDMVFHPLGRSNPDTANAWGRRNCGKTGAHAGASVGGLWGLSRVTTPCSPGRYPADKLCTLVWGDTGQRA